MPDFVVLTVRARVVAELIRGALEAEGIVVALDRELLAGVYGLDAGTWATKVLVLASEQERAQRLLDELEADDWSD
ncbi:MAG: hypothetical protein ACR2MA_05515 [Egibacteraceae bacterium]